MRCNFNHIALSVVYFQNNLQNRPGGRPRVWSTVKGIAIVGINSSPVVVGVQHDPLVVPARHLLALPRAQLRLPVAGYEQLQPGRCQTSTIVFITRGDINTIIIKWQTNTISSTILFSAMNDTPCTPLDAYSPSHLYILSLSFTFLPPALFFLHYGSLLEAPRMLQDFIGDGCHSPLRGSSGFVFYSIYIAIKDMMSYSVCIKHITIINK